VAASPGLCNPIDALRRRYRFHDVRFFTVHLAALDAPHRQDGAMQVLQRVQCVPVSDVLSERIVEHTDLRNGCTGSGEPDGAPKYLAHFRAHALLVLFVIRGVHLDALKHVRIAF